MRDLRVEALDERLNTGALLFIKKWRRNQFRNHAPARRRSQVAPLALRNFLIYRMRQNLRCFQAAFTAEEFMLRDIFAVRNQSSVRESMMQ